MRSCRDPVRTRVATLTNWLSAANLACEAPNYCTVAPTLPTACCEALIAYGPSYDPSRFELSGSRKKAVTASLVVLASTTGTISNIAPVPRQCRIQL